MPTTCLKPAYCEDNDVLEIGVDEAGRGPMFGRVYTGAVILPKSMDAFQHTLMTLFNGQKDEQVMLIYDL